MDVSADAILNQEDIDSLLRSGAALANGPIIRYNGQRVTEGESIRVSAYDFTDPVYLDERMLARLTERADSFIKSLAARLSVFLKLDARIKLGEIRTTPYQLVVETFTSPTFISIFRLDPLPGVGLLNFPPRMAMAIVDRMLGGQGVAPTEGRLLTEIERVLIEDIVDLILEEWVRPWSSLATLEPCRIGSETVGVFLQTSPPKDVMLGISIEVTILDCVEVLQLALPYSLFEPVLYKMEASARRFAEEAVVGLHHTFNKELCSQLDIPLVAEWKAFSLSVGDLLRLRPGDILELPQDILTKTRILFSGEPRFQGEVGVDNGRVAVRLSKIIEKP